MPVDATEPMPDLTMCKCGHVRAMHKDAYGTLRGCAGLLDQSGHSICPCVDFVHQSKRFKHERTFKRPQMITFEYKL